jgi:hypothetical protein
MSRFGRVGLYDMDEHNYFYHIDYKVTKCKISLCSWFLTWIFFFQFCDIKIGNFFQKYKKWSNFTLDKRFQKKPSFFVGILKILVRKRNGLKPFFLFF